MRLWIPSGARQRAVVHSLLRSHGMNVDFAHAICMMDTELRAAVTYSDFNRATCQIQIAADSHGHWCNRHFLWAIFDYPFTQCGMAELFAWVSARNEHMQAILPRLGFRYRYGVPQGYSSDTALLLFTLRKQDARVFERYARHEKLKDSAAA